MWHERYLENQVSSNKPFILVMMLGLIALVIAGCSGGGDEEPTSEPNPTAQPGSTSAPLATTKPAGDAGESGTGTLEVRVTDAPDPSITAVYVTTDNIEVSIAGEGWVSVIDEEITFELLALEGVEAVLGTAELPTGKYTQVRLDVPSVEVEKDGEIVIAEVPSDTIKLVGTFELAEDEKTFISLDFEVDESLVERGRQGFLFKPVIKLAVGEPGEEGSPAVALTGKPTGQPTPKPVPTNVAPPKPTQVPATATAVPPTATPEPTATPTAVPNAIGAFFLHIAEPESGEAIVTTDTFDVVGRTSVDALVSVNDEFPEVGIDGVFTSTVTLDEGPNVVEVVASTASGDESSIVLLIIYEPAA
jgi:hypothetical protein